MYAVSKSDGKEEERMKKLKCFLGKRKEELFGCHITAGAGARGMRPGRLGLSLSAPKRFRRAARRVPSPSGRSMIEMLAVLAIIGVLSIAALVGFTYAMNKHRANETIYDVMLRGTNVPMIDEYYYDKASGYEFRFPDLPAGTYYPMTTKKDAGSSYYVEATGVTYRVCEMILKMNPTDIDQIVVGNTVYQGDSDICGNTDGLAMKFCFGEDGTICDGTGQGGSGSGGSSGGTSGSSGSGSSGEPVDPCEGIIASTDCSITADETDSNGCVTVKKITCTGDAYCSGTTCEPCPAAETCDGESCCTLTGPNDVCGRPTKEVGTLSTVTHSDLNANGCCETTTEESCSLNPVTPRTCTPTCDGTCESDGSCSSNNCSTDAECGDGKICSNGLCCPETRVNIDGVCTTPETTKCTSCKDAQAVVGYPCMMFGYIDDIDVQLYPLECPSGPEPGVSLPYGVVENLHTYCSALCATQGRRSLSAPEYISWTKAGFGSGERCSGVTSTEVSGLCEDYWSGCMTECHNYCYSGKCDVESKANPIGDGGDFDCLCI